MVDLTVIQVVGHEWNEILVLIGINSACTGSVIVPADQR